MTIYEKETLFESLDETFTEIKAYVEGAIGQEELHEVEQNLFRRVLGLGRGFMETFIALSGTGYEADNPPFSEDGQPWNIRGRRRKDRPICQSLEKSGSTVQGMPILTGVGCILSMRN